MKGILAGLTALVTALSPAIFPEEHSIQQSAPQSIVIDGNRLNLSFEDDFNGEELDLTKWERCPEWDRQDGGGKWDDSKSYLDGNGNLIIEMAYDRTTNKYLSGAVRTKGLFEQKYGYYEIRCTLNTIPTYWTAFWLMGENVGNVDQSGRDGTEIDIYESAYYKQGMIQHALHWDGYGADHRSDGKKVVADVYDGDYHTFSLLWTRNEYIFYIDGTETWRTTADLADGVCREPLYMKISSEMGSWTGKMDNSTLPDYMKVDYVRVYS